MSLEKHLPKSVKVRSTCNACQQAKIRCSHDKPSCRRCQKHNIDCVYSMSRRLGRPAKKKDSLPLPLEEQVKVCLDQRREKKVKTASKKRCREKEAKREDAMDALSEESLQTPSLPEMEQIPFTVPDIDPGDNWLHDFVSTQIPDPGVAECGLFDVHDYSSKTDDILAFPTAYKDPMPMNYATTAESLDPSYYVDSRGITDFQSLDYMTVPPMTSPEYSKKSHSLPEQPMETIQPISDNQVYLKEYDHDYSSPLEFIISEQDIHPHSPCQCHEQATRELLRVNLCAARTMPPSPIDTILTCQRGLQQLAETILQCATCSRTRVNLLMVVIVCIDSLLTTLEATTAAKSGFLEDLGLSEEKDCFMSSPMMGSNMLGKKYKEGNPTFKSQIEACPLLVGNFRVPSEEKYMFIKQVLQSRLSGLLATIRRIRGCTQGILANSSSKGRLIMMMETDRRLQMIMMKIKMLTR